METIEMEGRHEEVVQMLPSRNETGQEERKININEIEEAFKRRNFRRGFSLVDENKDGKIDIHELQQLNKKMGNKIPRDVSRKIIEMVDHNNDGYLDLQEFTNMVNHPQLKVLFGRYLNSYVHSIVPKRNDPVIDGDDIDGQYEAEYSCWPPPVGMVLISVCIIVLFSIDEYHYNAVNGTGLMAGYLMYDPERRYQAWRYISYMLVHIGHMHLVVNLLIQILLGIPLEMVHRSYRVLTVYLAGVLAGSLGTSLTDPYTRLAGASGGVYSLLTAHIACVIMNWKEMSLPLVQLFVFMAVILTDFGNAIYERYYLEKVTNIGYVAHIAGALAGLFVGLFVLRNLETKSWENKLWWIACSIFFAFIIFAVIWNVVYSGYYPTPT